MSFDHLSCNFTPLDYYLWGDVKDKYYADKPEIIDALKDNICETIGEIQLHSIDNVLKNWIDSVGYCMASRDSHLNDKKIKKKKFEKIFRSFFKALKKLYGGPF